MSMSGRTQYFNLKTYRVGDTVNFMPDFNDDMSTIDEQMHNNQQTGLSNSQQLETQQQAMTNMQNEIDEINAKLPGLEKWTRIQATPNTANHFKTAPQIYESENFLAINLRLDMTQGTAANEFPVRIEINIEGKTHYLIPMFSIPGNPFSLAEGAINRSEITMAMCTNIATGDSKNRTMADAITAWYIDGQTHFGVEVSQSYVNVITGYYFPGNLVPKVI